MRWSRHRERKKKKKTTEDVAGIFIPAGFLTGFGIGLAVDNVPAGMFAGIGVGFFLYAIILLVKK